MAREHGANRTFRSVQRCDRFSRAYRLEGLATPPERRRLKLQRTSPYDHYNNFDISHQAQCNRSLWTTAMVCCEWRCGRFVPSGHFKLPTIFQKSGGRLNDYPDVPIVIVKKKNSRLESVFSLQAGPMNFKLGDDEQSRKKTSTESSQ